MRTFQNKANQKTCQHDTQVHVPFYFFLQAITVVSKEQIPAIRQTGSFVSPTMLIRQSFKNEEKTAGCSWFECPHHKQENNSVQNACLPIIVIKFLMGVSREVRRIPVVRYGEQYSPSFLRAHRLSLVYNIITDFISIMTYFTKRDNLQFIKVLKSYKLADSPNLLLFTD